MRLRRADGAQPLVIGHRGAAAIAPENTLAALQAAVDAGADLVEFDIGPDLKLSHSQLEVPDDQISLDDALAFLMEHGVGAHLDAKLPGYEQQIVDAARRHRIEERVVISTAFARSARRFQAIAPELPCAIGYPRDSYGISRLRWPDGLTRAGAAALRQAMPVRIPVLLRSARADTLSLHHALCSRTAVRVSHSLGAPVLAWTANDPGTVRRLVAIGVDAVVSDDPGMTRETLATLLAQ